VGVPGTKQCAPKHRGSLPSAILDLSIKSLSFSLHLHLHLSLLLFLATVPVGGQPLPVPVLPHADQVPGHGQHPVRPHPTGLPQAGGEDHEESVRAESDPPRATAIADLTTLALGSATPPPMKRVLLYPAWSLAFIFYIFLLHKGPFFPPPGDFHGRSSPWKGEAQAAELGRILSSRHLFSPRGLYLTPASRFLNSDIFEASGFLLVDERGVRLVVHTHAHSAGQWCSVPNTSCLID